MGTDIEPSRVREWIDEELVEEVEQVEDPMAEFNFTLRMSGIFLHVIKRQPGGPLIVGQQMEFDDEIRGRINELPGGERGELLARIREALMQVPVVYGFQNAADENVAFDEMHHIFVEHRIYPDEATQQAVMDGLIAVWKAMRYLDDIWSLMDGIEGGAGAPTSSP